MVESFEKIPLEEIILFVTINFLVICQVSMSQKSFGTLELIWLDKMWKIRLQKPVFAVISKFSVFQSCISSSFISS